MIALKQKMQQAKQLQSQPEPTNQTEVKREMTDE